MEMNDEIAAPQPASPAHFWRFYRRLKPAPPLYPRSGHLTVRYRAHIPADEEDPSYNAIFDNTRFVYPIQKTVAQPTRLPTTTSFRPLKESKASLVILAVDQAEKSRVRQVKKTTCHFCRNKRPSRNKRPLKTVIFQVTKLFFIYYIKGFQLCIRQ